VGGKETPPASSEKEEERKQQSVAEAIKRRLDRMGKAHAGMLKILPYLNELYAARINKSADIFSSFPADLFRLPPDENLNWLIGKLENCARWIGFRYYGSGEVFLRNVCMCRKDLLCPFCAMQRSSKLLRDYTARFEMARKAHLQLIPVLITLTVKNGFELSGRVEKLFSSLKKIKGKRRNAKSGGRCKGELNKIVGAFGAYEITYNEKTGWHPHVHIVAFVDDWIDRVALSQEWLEITGDSKIVDVRKIDEDNVGTALRYVVKYVLKANKLTPSQIYECYLLLRDRKKIFSLGVVRGLKPEKDGKAAALDATPYADLQYSYQDGAYRAANPAAKKLHGG
jgi:hypothetical protein